MRISVKVAPGVRVSGRLGGHRHHHHHHGRGARIIGNRSPWLYSLPPWRLRGTSGLSGLFLAWLYVGVWFMELELWLMVWFYYGTFLAARQIVRWLWRHNPVGRTIDRRAAQRDRQQRPPYDPHGAPQQYYDLGAGDRP